ncbi:hypothetical protein [Ekhidna sp.]|uniref:hypothetical protein n=1 Tax=Ekhidna sp. TaxID=2608089 RepID=UPI003CCBB353
MSSIHKKAHEFALENISEEQMKSIKIDQDLLIKVRHENQNGDLAWKGDLKLIKRSKTKFDSYPVGKWHHFGFMEDDNQEMILFETHDLYDQNGRILASQTLAKKTGRLIDHYKITPSEDPDYLFLLNYKSYHKNGNLNTQSTFVSKKEVLPFYSPFEYFKKHGEVRVFDESGQLISCSTYRFGKKINDTCE